MAETIVKVQRAIKKEALTIGDLYINGKRYCYTLEDTVRPAGEKIYGETAIPAGRYKITLRKEGGMYPDYVNRYTDIGQERGMLWLRDIPGYEYVYIHVGNYAKETLGCILVGFNYSGGDMIENSVAAYKTIYPIIADAITRGDSVFCEVS